MMVSGELNMKRNGVDERYKAGGDPLWRTETGHRLEFIFVA